MSKFDIHKNTPLPSDEEINTYKNFGKVVKKSQLYDYRKATRPLYKNIKVMGVIVAIVAVMMILMFESDDPESKTMNDPEDSAAVSSDTLHKQSVPQQENDSVTGNPHPSSSTQTTGYTAAAQANVNAVVQTDVQTTVSDIPDETIYDHVSESAAFPGGETALSNFLTKNIKYPYNAVANPFSGKVEVKMVVEKSGKLTSVSVQNSPNAAITAEIKRVVSIMPNWTPAKISSKTVRSTITVAFPFVYREE